MYSEIATLSIRYPFTVPTKSKQYGDPFMTQLISMSCSQLRSPKQVLEIVSKGAEKIKKRSRAIGFSLCFATLSYTRIFKNHLPHCVSRSGNSSQLPALNPIPSPGFDNGADLTDYYFSFWSSSLFGESLALFLHVYVVFVLLFNIPAFFYPCPKFPSGNQTVKHKAVSYVIHRSLFSTAATTVESVGE